MKSDEQDGQAFIAMEFLDGQTLKHMIGNRPMELETLLSLGIEIADALDAAHSEGIVHRDIKPANIFVTERGHAKILDFGLAKVTATGARPGSDATETDTAGATPDESRYGSRYGGLYVAGAGAGQGTGRAYRPVLLRRGALRDGDRGIAVPWGKLGGHLSTRSWTARRLPPLRLNPDLPPKLEDIINKALEKDRELRYQDAAEMRAELKRMKRDTETGRVGADSSGAVAGARDSDSTRSDRSSLCQPQAQFRTVPSSSAAVNVAEVPTASGRKLWKFLVPAAVVVGVALIGGGLYLRSRPATPLTEKDTIVLADFDNKTGDPVFDDALKQALAVQLGQSPFLNILSDRKVEETLQLMGRPSTERITRDIARELCIRTGSKALLVGSISNLGSQYVLGVDAVGCSTGDTLAKEQVEAATKQDVLNALSKASSSLRAKLGESLATVQKFDVPVEATTPSLEALKAFSMGITTFRTKGNAEAIPFYKRAIELDPNFAVAYASLGLVYGNLGQANLSAQNIKKAYELRDRVSEREKYRISALYYQNVTGELEQASQVYELWAKSYPKDSIPPGNLGYIYSQLGQYDKALAANAESQRSRRCTRLFQRRRYLSGAEPDR